MLRLYAFSGRLVLQDGLDYKFGIYDNKRVEYHDISGVLSDIYFSNNQNIKIEIYDLESNQKVLLSKGELYIAKDEFGVYGYTIGGVSLDLILHNLVKKNISIFIDHCGEEVEEVEDGETL